MTVRISQSSAARVAQIYRANSIAPVDARSYRKNESTPGSSATTDSVHFSREALERAKLLQQGEVEELDRRTTMQQKLDEELRLNLNLLDPDTQAPLEAVKRAYRYLIRHYHPDKYADLPPEFRELADAKSRQIIHAYRKANRSS